MARVRRGWVSDLRGRCERKVGGVGVEVMLAAECKRRRAVARFVVQRRLIAGGRVCSIEG